MTEPSRWMLTLNWTWKDNSDGYKFENVLTEGSVSAMTTEAIDWSVDDNSSLKQDLLEWLSGLLMANLTVKAQSKKAQGASID